MSSAHHQVLQLIKKLQESIINWLRGECSFIWQADHKAVTNYPIDSIHQCHRMLITYIYIMYIMYLSYTSIPRNVTGQLPTEAASTVALIRDKQDQPGTASSHHTRPWFIYHRYCVLLYRSVSITGSSWISQHVIRPTRARAPSAGPPIASDYPPQANSYPRLTD